MDKKIREILNYAVMAPSGDNSQPWEFRLDGSILEVFNLPEKDNPYLNFMQSGSLIAHGALLKNIEIASQEFDLIPKIELLPDKNQENLIARVEFIESVKKISNPLFEFIDKRSTNRRKYKSSILGIKEEEILKEEGLLDDIFVKFITQEEEKKQAGEAGSSAEVVILENSILHNYLFQDVKWSKAQESRDKHGLYINTMEFNPVQLLLFWLASKRFFMDIAIKLGLPKFIAKEDAKLYASGFAVGLIGLKDISSTNFVKLGMRMQEIWLKAAALGFAFQPITATCFFGFRLNSAGSDKTLSDEHKNFILHYYNRIFEIFSLEKNETPFVMFRIGLAKNPSARSSRKAPIFKI